MLITSSITAQTFIGASQDVKLAFQGDEKGNEAFTTNLRFRISQAFRTLDFNRSKTFDRFSFSIYADYEYADLQETFHSWNIGFAPTIFMFNNNFSASVFYGTGRIYRGGETSDIRKAIPFWNLSAQLAFKIKGRLWISFELQQSKREDLPNVPFIYSGFVGLRYEIGKLPLFND